MFFAIDPLIPADIRNQLRLLVPTHAHLNWFALVDRSFDHGAPRQVPAHPANVTRIYRGTPLDDLREVSPVLIPIPLASNGDERLAEQFDALLAHCAGRPMLSFVACSSNKSAEDIAQAWDALHFVHDADGERFLLCFADTRVLHALPECLAPAHWAALHKAVLCWFAPDRRGKLVQLPPPPSTVRPQVPRQLSPETLARMLKANHADSVAAFWETSTPEWLPAVNRARFWAILQAACREADEDTSLPDLSKLCRTAWAAETGARQ
jgi:hypothetical protein